MPWQPDSDVHREVKRLIASGDLDSAESLCRRALDSGEDAHAVYLMAVIKAQRGKLGDAITFFEWAAESLPKDADIAYNFGVVCVTAGLTERAVAEWQRAITLRPDYLQAHYNLAKGLADLGRTDDAVAAYETLLRLAPDHADGRYNVANLLFRVGRYQAAREQYRLVLAAHPDHAKAWINLGMAAKRLRDLAAAEDAYRRALVLDPESADAHWNLSHVLMLQRRWRDGFAEFEWRLKLPAMKPPSWPQPAWTGDDLAGRRIVLYAEQGIGDAIHFLRYARLVAARAAEVIVCCHPGLAPLAERAAGVARAVPFGGTLPEYDTFASLMSLPHLLALPEPAASWHGSYLTPPSMLPVTIRGDGLRIGLVWAGNPAHELDRERSCPIERLAPLITLPGVTIFSLQVGAAAADFKNQPFANRIIDVCPHLTDFAVTAAVVARLDAVVSVDTAVAHLAGALGVPVFLMLPWDCDWRWGSAGDTTPWYPTMRLFRQPAPGDWGSVVAAIGRTLRAGGA
jgi:tetratricopeptide (TPR) repeat protein